MRSISDDVLSATTVLPNYQHIISSFLIEIAARDPYVRPRYIPASDSTFPDADRPNKAMSSTDIGEVQDFG